MAVTENFGWPLPDETATVREEMERLRDQTLPAIDADMHALGVEVAGKADDDHVHVIGDVTDLQPALDGKMPANMTFAVGDLTDVVGADAAPDGYVLVKVGDQWVAQAAAAAIGDHEHTMDQVVGLEDALDALAPLSSPTLSNATLTGNPTAPTPTAGDNDTSIATTAFVQTALASLNDYWALQPVGTLVALWDHITGITAPATDKAYRYVKLTASDGYNASVLTGETVTGSAPLVQATAVINDSGSPLNGQTVRLINTERRFLRAGNSGTAQAAQLGYHRHGLASTGGGNTVSGSAIGFGFQNQGYATAAFTDYLGATTDENLVKNIGVTYYMRIK